MSLSAEPLSELNQMSCTTLNICLSSHSVEISVEINSVEIIQERFQNIYSILSNFSQFSSICILSAQVSGRADALRHLPGAADQEVCGSDRRVSRRSARPELGHGGPGGAEETHL